MEATACEIGRLPEELLSAALARTSPRDACRAAAVSPAFRAAADSDAVWACFLPRDPLPPLADGELPPPTRKKDLFLRLSDSPVLLQDKLVVRTYLLIDPWRFLGLVANQLVGGGCARRVCGWTGRPAPSATCCRRGTWSSCGATRRGTGAGSLSPTLGSSARSLLASYSGARLYQLYMHSSCF